MWASAEVDHEDDVQVEVSTGVRDEPRVRILYGQLAIRLRVDEAVDLVDAVAGALAEIEQRTPREIRRDESGVRADAEVREGLS
jgi:hypothetical protein